jgi:large subunit ribosomal protein L5
MSRLKELYDSKLKTELKNSLNCKNLFEVPRLKKIVLNMGVGETVTDAKKINAALDDLTLIAGQKPAITKAKQSIATFKLRKGMNIGCKVTLRNERMYEFLDRLITIALPRVRDFKGLSKKSFDGKGNYSLGLKEQIIFPEINYDKIDKVRGLDVSIVTSSEKDSDALELLKGFNFPFNN